MIYKGNSECNVLIYTSYVFSISFTLFYSKSLHKIPFEKLFYSASFFLASIIRKLYKSKLAQFERFCSSRAINFKTYFVYALHTKLKYQKIKNIAELFVV